MIENIILALLISSFALVLILGTMVAFGIIDIFDEDEE